jgi:hypothetical protein
MMVIAPAETCWNNEEGYHTVFPQTEIELVYKNLIYFALLVHRQEYITYIEFLSTNSISVCETTYWYPPSLSQARSSSRAVNLYQWLWYCKKRKIQMYSLNYNIWKVMCFVFLNIILEWVMWVVVLEGRIRGSGHPQP